jgi:hypothetical protein
MDCGQKNAECSLQKTEERMQAVDGEKYFSQYSSALLTDFLFIPTVSPEAG